MRLRLETASERMIAQVGEVLAKYLDGDSCSPLAVAFSGGSDSLATLLITLDFAAKRGRKVLALTVDHGLQAASRGWTDHCATLAAQLGAQPLSLLWEEDRPIAGAAGLSAAARSARHRLLAKAAKANGAKVVILGHTQDDQYESDWMRRAEGASLGQIKVWAPSPVWPEGRGVFLLRPLLDQSREDLRGLVKDRGLDWIEDPANQDPKFARARARMALASEDGLAVTDRPLSATPFWPQQLGSWTDHGALVLNRAELRTAQRGLDDFMARALLSVSGQETTPRRASLERLTMALRTEDLFERTLSGVKVMARADQVWMVRELGRKGLNPLTLKPSHEGDQVWDGRFTMDADRAGIEVMALRGQTKKLGPFDQKRLADLPAPLRQTLPVGVSADGSVRLSVFEAGDFAESLSAESLILQRLRGACGRIMTEQAIR